MIKSTLYVKGSIKPTVCPQYPYKVLGTSFTKGHEFTVIEAYVANLEEAIKYWPNTVYLYRTEEVPEPEAKEFPHSEDYYEGGPCLWCNIEPFKPQNPGKSRSVLVVRSPGSKYVIVTGIDSGEPAVLGFFSSELSAQDYGNKHLGPYEEPDTDWLVLQVHKPTKV